MSAATIAPATIADLERAFDGRIPGGLIELARRAPEKVAGICRTRGQAKLKAGVVRAAMAEAIVEIFEAQGGEVSEADLMARGFTRKDIHDHGSAAKAAARPRLRRDRSAA
jgi:hypothetical protein